MRTARIVICAALGAGWATSLPAQTGSDTLVRPTVVSRAVFRNPRITESSGVIRSRTQPGVLWTFNDSGNPPELFATDTAGGDLGVYTHPGLQNRDWEAMATVPCGERYCLLVGDIGDNKEERSEIAIYRWPEPRIGEAALPTIPERIRVRYADGAHDTEAMFARADGTIYLITKGRSGGIKVFRIPAAAWTGRDSVVVAPLLQPLPIPADQGVTQWVTDAALSADGTRVVVRTYRYLHFYTLEADGRLTADPARPTCDLGGLEPQGEGVDWLDDQHLVLTSEQVATMGRSVIVVSCPAR